MEQAILFWISTKTICKKSLAMNLSPYHPTQPSTIYHHLPRHVLKARLCPHHHWELLRYHDCSFQRSQRKRCQPMHGWCSTRWYCWAWWPFLGRGGCWWSKKMDPWNSCASCVCVFLLYIALWIQSGSREICEIDIGIHLLQVQVLRHDPAKSKIVQAHTQLKVFEDIAKCLKLQQSTIGSFCIKPCNQSLCFISLFFSVTPIL